MANPTLNRPSQQSNFDASARVEVVRSLNPILEVVGEHVQLRRSGAQFRGLCPFHSERTPSLYICPAKQVFRCHGCGAGGDVFRFVETLHHCTFPEAVQFLAARAGLELDSFEPSPELIAKVAADKAEREAELAFRRFCNARFDAIDQRYRSLARAATNAEDYLRSGLSDPYIDDLAWSALERFRLFEASIEREGLCDPDILKTEWSKLHDAA